MDVFGSSGVRGVALDDLTPALALDVAQAAGSAFGRDWVAVGRDTRLTGEVFVSSVASGLASVGCAVDRLGVVPTPALQAYCEREGVPGVMVTASHNPPEFNGIKLVGPDGVELTRAALQDVETWLEADPELTDWETTGDIRQVNGVNRTYREQLLDAVDSEAIADAGLTIALDPGHGAGALISPDLFSDLGCSVTTVNAQPDGHFPGRDPEPVADNLAELGRLVRSSDADVGIAHDGDADRAVFFDECGEFIEGDAALAALAAAELAAGDTVVSAANASQRLVDVADAVGAELHLTPIGSTNIITAIRGLREQGATIPVAGEGNGGVIFPDYRLARDGAYTAARFCELLVDQSASEAVADYGGYHNVRRNIPHADDTERAAMVERIEQIARESDAEVDTIDGYRFDHGDAWVLARPSGTEPVVRVYAEARERARAKTLADEMVERIQSAVGTP
jgi:phosphomannomutase/phosphoglucomutase